MCDTIGCDAPPEFWDEMDNKLCESCMLRDAEASEKGLECYEPFPF